MDEHGDGRADQNGYEHGGRGSHKTAEEVSQNKVHLSPDQAAAGGEKGRGEILGSQSHAEVDGQADKHDPAAGNKSRITKRALCNSREKTVDMIKECREKGGLDGKDKAGFFAHRLISFQFMHFADNRFDPIPDLCKLLIIEFIYIIKEAAAVIRAFAAGTDQDPILFQIAADAHGIDTVSRIIRQDNVECCLVHQVKILFSEKAVCRYQDIASFHWIRIGKMHGHPPSMFEMSKQVFLSILYYKKAWLCSF